MRRRLVRVLSLVALLPVIQSAAFAGGPRYVAGTSYFEPGLKGTPVTWAQGNVTYFTDQGDLGPALPGPSADALIAAAFSNWTSISTAAVTAVHGGQLAEDVTGGRLSSGLPSDIATDATAQPVAFVYDLDGSVTEDLIGQGASDPALCASNAVSGGIDNIGADAHFLHALIVLNGRCAQTSSQLPELKYHLVRMLGQVLGLDWSQANVNVVSQVPAPTADELPGFPLMHAVDPPGCPACYGTAVDPTLPKADDQAALARLYPVSAQNQNDFPGKQISTAQTARIFGNVYFVDAIGAAAQPMQGVNVVAHYVDRQTNLVSNAAVVSSVSGFLFRGNNGNPVTGTADGDDQLFSKFGSDDPTMEGFFDLSNLPVPAGITNPEFELEFEAIDPVWSNGIEPYGTMQVMPSGNAARMFVSVTTGGELHQDLLMTGSGVFAPDWFGPTTFAAPAAVPAGGDWIGFLAPYGDVDYFQFPAQANRTASVSVTALDDAGKPTANKAQPVIGSWPPGGLPGFATPIPLNTSIPGESRLDFSLASAAAYTIGITDFRGDGRPDFRYHAHVLYGDTVVPPRVSAAAGTLLSIRGLGFRLGDTVSAGSVNLPVVGLSANQILVAAPSGTDGVRNLTINDPATGSSSVMIAALICGAASGDLLRLVSGTGQQAPAGGTLPDPIVVRAVAADQATPVAGATVVFSSSPAGVLSACQGAATCKLLTDQNGLASTLVTVPSTQRAAAFPITITAKLAPDSYNPPQQVTANAVGTQSTLDIALTPQTAWIAQGASIQIPLTARVLGGGAAIPGRLVDFQILKGTATLSSPTAISDSNGYASATLQLNSLSKSVLVSVCIHNASESPCLNFSGTVVPLASLELQPVSGGMQLTPDVQPFVPVAVRVIDSATPAHAVAGATVVFQATVARMPAGTPPVSIGDTQIGSSPLPVILSSSEAAVPTGGAGLAAFQPSAGAQQGAVIVLGSASAGNQTLPFRLQSVSPSASPPTSSASTPVRSNLERDLLAH